jgi:DNA-directed RNA polymerase specialized sigma24 family protein
VNAGTDGFACFVEARQRALQRTAWLLTGDWALAEDLVQTAAPAPFCPHPAWMDR